MAFFKLTPNLPEGEKARIEFHLQQIAECIGFKRFTLPVLSQDSVLYGSSRSEYQTANQVVRFAGEHLGHDVSGISIQTVPLPPEKCGGGG
jgi:hypothetical protein